MRVVLQRVARARVAVDGEVVAASVEALGVRVATGRFGAEMAVELVNDGPFTLWLDTDDR